MSKNIVEEIEERTLQLKRTPNHHNVVKGQTSLDNFITTPTKEMSDETKILQKNTNYQQKNGANSSDDITQRKTKSGDIKNVNSNTKTATNKNNNSVIEHSFDKVVLDYDKIVMNDVDIVKLAKDEKAKKQKNAVEKAVVPNVNVKKGNIDLTSKANSVDLVGVIKQNESTKKHVEKEQGEIQNVYNYYMQLKNNAGLGFAETNAKSRDIIDSKLKEIFTDVQSTTRHSNPNKIDNHAQTNNSTNVENVSDSQQYGELLADDAQMPNDDQLKFVNPNYRAGLNQNSNANVDTSTISVDENIVYTDVDLVDDASKSNENDSQVVGSNVMSKDNVVGKNNNNTNNETTSDELDANSTNEIANKSEPSVDTSRITADKDVEYTDVDLVGDNENVNTTIFNTSTVNVDKDVEYTDVDLVGEDELESDNVSDIYDINYKNANKVYMMRANASVLNERTKLLEKLHLRGLKKACLNFVRKAKVVIKNRHPQLKKFDSSKPSKAKQLLSKLNIFSKKQNNANSQNPFEIFNYVIPDFSASLNLLHDNIWFSSAKTSKETQLDSYLIHRQKSRYATSNLFEVVEEISKETQNCNVQIEEYNERVCQPLFQNAKTLTSQLQATEVIAKTVKEKLKNVLENANNTQQDSQEVDKTILQLKNDFEQFFDGQISCFAQEKTKFDTAVKHAKFYNINLSQNISTIKNAKRNLHDIAISLGKNPMNAEMCYDFKQQLRNMKSLYDFDGNEKIQRTKCYIDASFDELYAELQELNALSNKVFDMDKAQQLMTLKCDGEKEVGKEQ